MDWTVEVLFPAGRGIYCFPTTSRPHKSPTQQEKLTNHLHLVPSLGMRGALTPVHNTSLS
jgi:hypothetical protein